MENEKQIVCGGFTFLANFDSANLARVEFVPRKPPIQPEPSTKPNKKPKINTVNRHLPKNPKTIECPDYEFNIWTNPDCAGTEFENCNRTWFHFGITGGTVFSLIKLNIIDLNKQSKMYSQGMAPVYKIVPGKCQWERIRDKPVFTSENNVFTISFKFQTTENVRAVTYFAFTYPFSYTELQQYLGTIDLKMSKQENHIPKPEIRFNKGLKIINDINDAVYYHRETLCHSLENRKIDLITISSHHNITAERETRLEKLFPDENVPRSFKFHDKKVIFISARVHPGETPSSFVMNGILNLLVQKDDPIAILLRRQFVFKLIPMLNPDGVARGHYRTDTRGCNLNRYYLNPSREFHPSIFGARALIRYHHYGEEVEDEMKVEKLDVSSQVDPTELSSESDFSSPSLESPKPVVECAGEDCGLVGEDVAENTVLTLDLYQTEGQLNEQNSKSSTPGMSVKSPPMKRSNESLTEKEEITVAVPCSSEEELSIPVDESKRFKSQSDLGVRTSPKRSARCKRASESGLFLYLDMHGHASKKGVFMYGNHFEKIEDSVECMLFPKIMSVNSQNFHFPACNFTEKNMYLRDKRDGTSREGSGRVAVLRLTGLIRSYTLECNYNTGRFVNKLPQCSRDLPGKSNTNLLVPPKYSPGVYEEIGRSLCVSFLDLTNSNPWSRIPNSEYHTIFGMRDWLRLKTISESFLYHRPIGRTLLRSKQPSKSSQTQVEDFIAIGFDYELEKKLEDVQRDVMEFSRCRDLPFETFSEVEQDEEDNSSNEDPKSEEERSSDSDETQDIPKPAIGEVFGSPKSFLPSTPHSSTRVASNRQRAARLLNQRDDFLTLLESFETKDAATKPFTLSGMENPQTLDNNNTCPGDHETDSSARSGKVMVGVFRSDIRAGKLLPNVLMTPVHSKQSVPGENDAEDVERKENMTAFRPPMLLNRREAGPSHSKRTLRMSSALQVRTSTSRPVKSIKKALCWTDKVPKFKQFTQKSEGGPEDAVVEGDTRTLHCDSEARTKVTSASDQCLYKQNPKRLKISRGDDSGKMKMAADWSKEDAVAGPSCSDLMAYGRLNRSAGKMAAGGGAGNGGGDGKKRGPAKSKQQISPIKFKKSLEKRRGSDASRKKSKTLFRKSGKIILTNNDLNKSAVDRKRRKN